MNKGDWNRAHMYAKLLFRIRAGKYPSSIADVERAKILHDWFKRTGREDVIKEAERLYNERVNEEDNYAVL